MRDIKPNNQTPDLIVVGSGFGGAVVACRMAQAGRSVVIMELGKDYQNDPIEEPEPDVESEEDTTRYGHFQVDRGNGMNVIRGIGVGGGSLHYFGVRLRTPHKVFENEKWPKQITRTVLDPYYDLAGEMLGATPLKPHPVLGIPKRSEAFLAGAEACEKCMKDTLEFVPIAVNTGSEPIQTPSGIPQTPCVFCGACLVGCPPSESFDGNVNARALLTLNYLAIAKKHGAIILAEHEVTGIHKKGDNFEVSYKNLSGRGLHREETMKATQVVLGAGTLGSTEILLKSEGSLNLNKKMLGMNFSGNGDFLAKTTDTPFDMQPTSGPTITVGGQFRSKDNEIYIEDLGSTPFFESVIGMDKNTPASRGDKRHEIGYLGMGSDAGNGILSLKGKLKERIHLTWDPTESLPLYGEIEGAMKELSQKLGGNYKKPQGYNEKKGTGLLTAHPLGGCVMSDESTEGVVNPQGEVHGVPGLFVADGAIVPSALVVNPSFTITALAERVAFWMIHGREMSTSDQNTPLNN